MSNARNRGSWTLQWLIYLFTGLLGILTYWLLGFVVSDIGSIPGPDYAALEHQELDSGLVEKSAELDGDIEKVDREIKEQQARQKILRDSTTNSQTTMDQLLDLQRLNLSKGVTPSDEERKALAESQQLFLTNQREYQRLNESVAQLHEQRRELDRQRRANHSMLTQARVPIQATYQRLSEQHKMRIALWKLAFLTPLLMVAAALYVKCRSSAYWALVYAFGAAVLIKVGFVMHEYFPARYFKYVLILVTLAVATRIIVYLLRSVAFPQMETLIKQYREAYEAFQCPICSHPIRRGPLRFMAWTRRSITKQIPPPATDAADEIYICPVCSTSLYEDCAQCGKVRHALLPACQHCGANIDIVITN